MKWLGDSWDFVFALQSGSWAAIAAWVAVVVGATTVVVTGRYAKAQIEQAKSQLRTAERARLEQAIASEAARQAAEVSRLEQANQAEAVRQQQAADAQKLREEQARPYVVVLLEPDRFHWGFADFVIKNYGKTAAYDIEIDCTPDLQVAPYERLDTGENITLLSYPRKLPMLAPEQGWRTAWDYAVSRNETDVVLPDVYHVDVSYRDANGVRYSSPNILDWAVLNDSLRVTTYTIHDLAKNLERDMKSHAGLLKDTRDAIRRVTGEHSGVWVYPVSASDERSYRAEQTEAQVKRMSERRRRMDDLTRRAQAQESAGEAPTASTAGVDEPSNIENSAAADSIE